MLVSKSKVLTLVLMGLGMVCGGRLLAEEQVSRQQPGGQQISSVKVKKKAKTGFQEQAPVKTKCVQDQTPVSAKGKPPRRYVSLPAQAPMPVSWGTPTTFVKPQTAPRQQFVSTSKKGKFNQEQGPARPGLRTVGTQQRQSTQSLQQ
jgi:hypothetical protein